MMSNKWMILLLFICSISWTLSAQDEVICRVEINPDSILMENYFIVSFSLENANGQFNEPDFSDFDIVSGPNKSSMVSIINGESKRTSSYSYYLKPRAPGTFYIYPVTFILDNDEVIETEPLELIVFANPEGRLIEPRSKNNMPNMSFDWFFGNNLFNQVQPDPQYTPQKKKKKQRKKYKF